jgi:hypothetical protein
MPWRTALVNPNSAFSGKKCGYSSSPEIDKAGACSCSGLKVC